MNINRLAGHAVASVPFSIIWATGASLAPGAAPWYIWALGVAPQAMAGLLVVIHEANDRAVDPAADYIAERGRPEIVRPPRRKELAR
jgi:ABC-type uncharacterized transport system permease subunit